MRILGYSKNKIKNKVLPARSEAPKLLYTVTSPTAANYWLGYSVVGLLPRRLG